MAFFRTGLVMDAIDEPAFTEKHRNNEKIESSINYDQFPPILSFRLRRLH